VEEAMSLLDSESVVAAGEVTVELGGEGGGVTRRTQGKIALDVCVFALGLPYLVCVN